MLKVLYAASNNHNARIQLNRFVRAVQGSALQLKVAAYKKSSPKGLNVDWTLDSLLNIYKPDLLSLDSDNLAIYFEQVKVYNPDLIISDLEYFTSYIANTLGTTLWQCSSSLINFAIDKQEKYNLGLFKYYAHSLNRDPVHTQRTVNLIDNSNENFVYSHYGDSKNPLKLERGFEWIRPYHQVAKDYAPCQHFITAGLSKNNKQILDVLKRYDDSVAFMDSQIEDHQSVRVKDIRIEDEYFCNLKNSVAFVCQGQSSFLADAFYNGKYSLIYPDYDDTESIINSHLSDHLSLGHIMTFKEDVSSFINWEVANENKPEIKYLHEKIEEII